MCADFEARNDIHVALSATCILFTGLLPYALGCSLLTALIHSLKGNASAAAAAATTAPIPVILSSSPSTPF